MPFGDGTGPAGMGPMTGRAAGYCAGYPVPGSMNPIPGRGFWGWGRGRGGGRGRRNWYYATGVPGWMRAGVGLPAFGGWFPGYPGARVAPQITKDQQLEALKGQAQFFNEQLEAIKQRIEELAAQEPGKK